MNVGSVALWGFVATVVLTSMMSAAQGMGLSRISMTLMVGAMFTRDRERANVIGFLVHLANGWIFAVLYAAVFESWCRATWWLGGGIGLVHGLAVLTVLMPLLPGFHRGMASEERGPEPTRLLEPPGFMALNYGQRTPLVTLTAHAVYGVVLGAFYHLSCR